MSGFHLNATGKQAAANGKELSLRDLTAALLVIWRT
jgi:hypothetical protein